MTSLPHGQHGHGQLHLLEDFVVLRVLRKGSELGKASPHATRLRVRSRKKVSGGLIGLGRIGGEVVPYAVKVDTLAAGYKPFGIWSMKIEVPYRRIEENLIPRVDARNWRSITTSRSTLSGYIAA